MPGHYPYRKGNPGCRRYSPPTAGRRCYQYYTGTLYGKKDPGGGPGQNASCRQLARENVGVSHAGRGDLQQRRVITDGLTRHNNTTFHRSWKRYHENFLECNTWFLLQINC